MCLQLCNWGFCVEYCVCVSMWKGCVNSWFSLNSTLRETQRNAHNLHTQARQKKKKTTTPECSCVNSRFCCYTSRLSDVLMHSKEKPKMLERRRSVKDWNRQRTKKKKKKKKKSETRSRPVGWSPGCRRRPVVDHPVWLLVLTIFHEPQFPLSTYETQPGPWVVREAMTNTHAKINCMLISY